MHTHFADWYRLISIEPKPEELQKRWQGVEVFSEAVSAEQLPDLARLFYKLPIRSDVFIEAFRAAFKKADESFPMRDNDAELQVLAGSVLVDLLRYASDWGIASALAVVSASFREVRRPAIAEIVGMARHHLATSSAELRSASADFPKSQKFKDQLDAMKAAFAKNDIGELTDPTVVLFQSLVNSVQELRSWATHSETAQKLRREESDALWWVFGATSRDLDKLFSSLPTEALPLIAAKELADLTYVLPGPLAAPALLATVLRQGTAISQQGKLALKDAVDSTDLEWRKVACASEWFTRLSDLCVVHLAVQKSVETDGKKAWQTVFATASGVRPTEKLTAIDLSVQAYQERLFARVIAELK